ncbi:S1C family serine protease [Oceanobacillus halotolerans]|uniref:S1C family serine protease n=1 Tax=Oceanobacillus halotolerans TaxID=2663380 RepID=UPI0013D8FBA9|nr:trypsin-like peptidase domain-containing protein [Oceanobacillus halotolerans]
MDRFSDNEKQEHLDDESKGLVASTKVNQKPKKRQTKYILSGLLGGVISAIIVTFLFTNNLIPISINEDNSTNQIASAENNEPENTPVISNDIVSEDADTASNINETSEAVVGILNMQQQNIWTPSQESGTGSGIIYKKEDGKAYIVTNNHVVEGAEEIEVVLSNEEHLEATLLGADELNDLAVLQVDGSSIDVVADLGVSGDVEVGDTVIAIGNPLGMEFSGSVTKGIISGLERSISVDTNGDRQPDWVTEVLQTDAAINPGNSGGALVNTEGEVIGINSMKIARQEVEGIGFAIPIDAALPIIEQLETEGEIIRPYIGISTAELSQVPMQYRNQIQLPEDVEGGMIVADVEMNSPADAAGLQQFDVITKINGEPIASLLDLRKYLYSETTVGDSVEIEIYRNGTKETVTLDLVEREN